MPSAWADSFGSSWGDSFGSLVIQPGDALHTNTLTPSEPSPHNEQTHYRLDIACRDANGDPFVPVSMSIRIDDFDSGASVLALTTLTPAADVEFLMASPYQRILDDARPYETRIVTVTTNEGLATERNDTYQALVINSRFVQ